MSTTFMHTGDEHIDSDTHSTINPATGRQTAWESNFRALNHLATVAAARGVDAFISAGDNFKTGRPSMEALLLFVEALAPVCEAGIPIVLLDGNHHMTGVSSDHRTVIHTLAEMLRARGATVFIASEPQLIRLPTGLQVAALPWLSKNRILNELGKSDVSPAEGDTIVAEYGLTTLENLANQADSSQPLIMASHVTVDDLRIDAVSKGFRRGSETELAHLFSEPVLPRKELEKLPFQYGALSHIHTPQKMGDRFWYAGSPNRITFTDMTDEKGGNLVTLDGDKLNVERILTPARVMAAIDLEDYDYEDALAALEPGTLVQLRLRTGDPEVPREVKKWIATAGAILADTKARPKPKPQQEKVVLPEQVDAVTALRTWADHNPTPGLTVDQLVDAARELEAAQKVKA